MLRFFELLLHLFGFFFCYLLFYGLGCAVYELFRFFEAEASDLTDDLDDADLVCAVVGEDYVKL